MRQAGDLDEGLDLRQPQLELPPRRVLRRHERLEVPEVVVLSASVVVVVVDDDDDDVVPRARRRAVAVAVVAVAVVVGLGLVGAEAHGAEPEAVVLGLVAKRLAAKLSEEVVVGVGVVRRLGRRRRRRGPRARAPPARRRAAQGPAPVPRDVRPVRAVRGVDESYVRLVRFVRLRVPGQEKGDSTSLHRGCSARARSKERHSRSRSLREMIARRKISRNEWKTTERGAV